MSVGVLVSVTSVAGLRSFVAVALSAVVVAYGDQCLVLQPEYRHVSALETVSWPTPVSVYGLSYASSYADSA